MKKGKPHADSESVHSSLSIFSNAEGAANRFQVKKEGYLDIAIQKSSDIKPTTGFTCKFCRVTGDGRFLLDENNKQDTMVIEECIMAEPNVFRLIAYKEADMKAQETIELWCKSQGEDDGAEWLICIETALRTRLQTFRTEVDAARGTMQIVEYDLTSKKLPSVNKAKTYPCFYYNGTIRVKNLDGPQTSSFKITGVKIDEINLPMCLLIQTPGRGFILKADDLDNYKKWLYAIRKDLKKKGVIDAEVSEKKDNKTEGDITQSNMLVGPKADNLIRVQASYNRNVYVFETKDFAGVVDTFYIQRCVIPFRSKDKCNLILHASLTNDPEESKTLKLYCLCDSKDFSMWVQSFEPSMVHLSFVIEKIIMQIELRRIMKNEAQTEKKKRNVTFHDIHFLLTLKESQLEDTFVNIQEWPVGRLERCIQVALRITPEPLVPYGLQQEFIHLGRDISHSKIPKEGHQKKAAEVIEKMPDLHREILEKLTLHIFRLTSHYSRRKTIETNQGVGGSKMSKKRSSGLSNFTAKNPNRSNNANASTQRNQDLTVWSRLSKYIFRFNEQNMSDDECENNLTYVSHVIYAFQTRYVNLLRGQATKSHTKKSDFERNCKQQ